MDIKDGVGKTRKKNCRGRPWITFWVYPPTLLLVLLLTPCFAPCLWPNAHRKRQLPPGDICADLPVRSVLLRDPLSHRGSPGAVRTADTNVRLYEHAAAHTMRRAVACTSLVWLASLGGSLAFVAIPPSARPRSSFSGDGLARMAVSSRLAHTGAPSR